MPACSEDVLEGAAAGSSSVELSAGALDVSRFREGLRAAIASESDAVNSERHKISALYQT